MPKNSFPSASAGDVSISLRSPSKAQSPGGTPAAAQPVPAAKRHTSAPVSASIAYIVSPMPTKTSSRPPTSATSAEPAAGYGAPGCTSAVKLHSLLPSARRSA